MLERLLAANVKTNEVIVECFSKEESKNDKVVAQLKSNIKEAKENAKEYKASLVEELKEGLKNPKNKELFIDYIVNEDQTQKELYKNMAAEDFAITLQNLENEITVITGIEKTIKKYSDSFKILYTKEEMFLLYINSNLDENELKKEQYRIWNTLETENLKKLELRYSIIRAALDKKIQGRITDKELIALYNNLNLKSKKIDKLTPKKKEKLIEEIGLIYNLSITENSARISSLNK